MTAAHPPDSQLKGLVALLPAALRPYALLARFDRPIGWWLLFWPCAFGIALAGGARPYWPLLLWMLVGAIAMRGAGCVYNDIVDRNLDAKVARTTEAVFGKARPSRGAFALPFRWSLHCLSGRARA